MYKDDEKILTDVSNDCCGHNHSGDDQKEICCTPHDESKNSVPEMSEAQLNEAQQKIKELFKEIPVTDLSIEKKKKLEDMVGQLHQLRDEITLKKQSVLEKSNYIESKLDMLSALQNVKIDKNQFALSQERVNKFVTLLNEVTREISGDIEFYNSLEGDQRLQTVMVFKAMSDSFDEYIDHRLIKLKSYIKTVRRDLTVSYSRYSFGFEEQIRNIDYVEQVLKVSKKTSSPTT